jgi:hypothetical protein
VTCKSSGVSGGTRVFVDQAAQDGFSVDPSAVEVSNGEVATVVFAIGGCAGRCPGAAGPSCSAPGTRPARCANAPHRELARGRGALGAGYKALAGCVHARCLDGGAQDPGPSGLEDGVERGREVRSAVTDEELDVLEPLVEGQGRLRACCTVHSPVGLAVDDLERHPASQP